MPIDYSRYPSDWQAIRERIMERATAPDGVARCEWCGVENHALIQRDPRNGERYRVLGDMEAEGAVLDGERVTLVVLTIAHLGTGHPDGRPGDRHDKHDCRDENLAALCQRCHLLYDLDDHIRHAAETRRRKRIDAGQRSFLEAAS